MQRSISILVALLLLAAPLRGQTPPVTSIGVTPNQAQWQFIAGAAAATWNPADSTDYYLILNDGSLVANPTSAIPSNASSSFYGHTLVPMTLRAVFLDMLCVGASTSETATLSIRVNNATNTQILTGITCTNNIGSGLVNVFSATNLAISLAANDWFVLKWTTPVWVTNPTGAFIVASLHATAP